MEIHRGDLVGAVGELKDAMAGIQAIRRELAVNGTTNNNSPAVNINAGGVGVWISATCCLICIALIPLCSAWISRELTRKDAEVAELRDKYERQQTYLAAIYAAAPHLKPKEK